MAPEYTKDRNHDHGEVPALGILFVVCMAGSLIRFTRMDVP